MQTPQAGIRLITGTDSYLILIHTQPIHLIQTSVTESRLDAAFQCVYSSVRFIYLMKSGAVTELLIYGVGLCLALIAQ